MSEEQKAAQKKIPCEMHKQGRCKGGAKCFKSHNFGKKKEESTDGSKGSDSNNQSNNRDKGLGGCPYCKSKDHKLGKCEKIKADEASGAKPPAWWTTRRPVGSEGWKQKKDTGDGRDRGHDPEGKSSKLYHSGYVMALKDWEPPKGEEEYQNYILMLNGERTAAVPIGDSGATLHGLPVGTPIKRESKVSQRN